MKMLKPLVFFGTEDFSAVTLKALLDADWPVELVITKPDSKRGRGQKLESPLVKRMADAAGIKVLQPENLIECESALRQQEVEFAVLVSYGKIIPKRIIDIFSGGIINVHPSLLPKYRGPSPIEETILNGDTRSGVSLMQLTPKMDAGPIYAQVGVDLDADETKTTLYKKLAIVGAELLIKNLPAITQGALQPTAQNDEKATYTPLLKSKDGEISWNDSAINIDRKIRAYQGFPKTRSRIDSHQVVLIKSRVAQDKDDGALVIPCRASYLEVLELIGPSGRLMSGADFARGYRK